MAMTEKEAARYFEQGLEMVALNSRTLAMLPLEEMLEALNRAETAGAIMDPTLYREYIYSDKAKALKELIEACLKVKAVVMKMQPLVRKEMEDSE